MLSRALTVEKYEKILSQQEYSTASKRVVFGNREQMSGLFRNYPSKKPNILTFPPPDLGMLRRSRRVLIFPKSRCIIYFGLR